MKIDFMCLGFPKCGTTTLDMVLRQHTQLSFPKIKETGYWSWYKLYSKPLEELEKYYVFNEQKQVGAIEPAWHRYAQWIKEQFGDDIKIIFVMRNPVDRLYSHFRMKIRNGSEGFKYYYKEFTRNEVSDMFDCYLNRQLGKEPKVKHGEFPDLFVRGDYAKWIKEYQQCFKPENIMYILFEDYIKDPQNILKNIQEFLGVEVQELDFSIQENDSKRISRNHVCATINKFCYKYFLQIFARTKMPCLCKVLGRKLVQKVWEMVGKITLVENSEKMSSKARETLQDYYRDSVKELEKVLGRDLSKVWFE